MKSPCCNAEMYGGKEMLCCPQCSTWYKADEVADQTAAAMLKAMGLDESMFRGRR